MVNKNYGNSIERKGCPINELNNDKVGFIKLNCENDYSFLEMPFLSQNQSGKKSGGNINVGNFSYMKATKENFE